MTEWRWARAGLALWLAGSSCALAGESVGGRIASTGLCSDQLVAILVPPGRIAGLSSQARDPRLSAVAEQARGLPEIFPSAEAYLWSGAEIIIGNEHGDPTTLGMMRRLGVTVLRLPSRDSFQANQDQLRRTAAALGVAETGEAWSEMIDERWRRVENAPTLDPPTMVYYRPDGGSAGSGTFMDEALTVAGYRNLAAATGRQGWGRMDLETLVMNTPQTVAIGFFDSPGWTVRRVFSRHPVFGRILADRPVISLPGSEIACSGWPLVLAAERLARFRTEERMP